MSQGREAARRGRKSAVGSADRLSGLPEGPLLHLLSFLPSRDAVRTCVLARRWRNLWKEVPALRITPATNSEYRNASTLNSFVNYLLFFRNRLPLHVAELSSHEGGDFDEAVQYFELWIRYSLSCGVAKLCVANHHNKNQYWQIPKGLITSEHLTTLQLTRVWTRHNLDFSSCVSLKDLKITDCAIYCRRIVSPSLKRLSIMQCGFPANIRTEISVPNLVLLLVDCEGRTPLLVNMPYLVEAFIRLGDCNDFCEHNYEIGDCGDGSCRGCRFAKDNYENNNSILLHGLSSCTNLELTTFTSQVHASLVEIGASYDLRKQPLVLKDLTVEVRCDNGHEQIHKVLDVLGSYGLPPENIKIQQPPKLTRAQLKDTWPSASFSFEQEI